MKNRNHRRCEREILASCRGLMREGVLQPTAAAIADRADVAIRTFFSHHASIDALRLAAVDDAETRRSVLDRLMGEEWRGDALSGEALDRILRAAVMGRL